MLSLFFILCLVLLIMAIWLFDQRRLKYWRDVPQKPQSTGSYMVSADGRSWTLEYSAAQPPAPGFRRGSNPPAPGLKPTPSFKLRRSGDPGNGFPTTPKPGIVPKPQFPPPRIIREDFFPGPADTIARESVAAVRAADAAISEQALAAEFRAWWHQQGRGPAHPQAVHTHVAWGQHLLSRGVQP